MAYPNQSSTSSTSTSLPYPHSYAYPYLYAPHPHSNLSTSSSSSTSFTPYSSTTPATTAPPSPTSTSSNTHAINLQRYYHHLNTFHPSSSNTSDHHQHYNMHHQSHPHLFPEQIQSASSFRPPSSQSHHSANGGVAAGGTTGSAAVSPYAQHGGHSAHAGPALQVAHPTAAANSLDMYRHRSASPWVSPHQQQQQQQQQQQHHITQPYQACGSNAGHNTSHSSSNSGALSLFNPTSYQTPSQHPLAQQSTHYHHGTYAFPSHYNNGHDPYHSPEASHATLPYGFPAHPPYHHSYSSSSLLDKHLLNPSSASNSRSNTPSHPYGSNKYPHLMQSESNMRSKIGGGSTNSSDKLPKMRITSGASVGSAEGGADSTMSTAGAGGRKSKGSKEGSSGADDVAPGGAANYGIIDELNTTLFDLRDGPDGPRGKPPYPYLTLIRIALISAPTKKLTLQELYDTLESRWPGHFAGDQKGWKNSIRHNLSLNKCFKKEARHILDPGKGAYWYCDLNEEHSTPRIRHRRKGDGEGEYDAEGEFVQPQPSGSKRGAARGKKRKVESPPSGVTGNAPDAYPPYPGYLHDDYTSTKQDSYSAHEDHVRSVKLRVGDLKLPFNTTSSSSSSGGLQIKRQRAISAPSPITPSFFNNFTSATQVGNDQQQYETKEEVGDLGLAPFGITSVGAGHHSSSYGSQQQPYSFPQIFTQPTQLQVPKYEFPSSTYGAPSGVSASVHQLPAMPSLMPDKAPQSGSTESSFALETPRTIDSGSNAAARPGTANSVSNGTGEAKPGLERLVKEENSSSVNLAAFSSSLNEGNTHGNDNGNSDNPPGPAQSYVFPATQKGPPESGQSKRVFVNPPGTSTATTAVTTLNTTISSVSPRGVHQSPPQRNLQGEVHVNAPLGNYAMPSSGISPHHHATSSNPFAVPHNQSAASSEDMRNRPSHLHINPKDGKNMFSPPSATSPTRHLNSEYGDMFSTAPFGLIFDAPSAKGTGRKGSLLGGLTAR